MEWLVLAGALALAFVNGANDNVKGVATLYGSGALGYRAAIALATAATALGGALSLAVGGALVQAFSAKGLLPDEALTPAYLAAVALGASGTVMIATRAGLPISTTHAIVGSLLGAGFVAAGSELRLGVLGRVFVIPLLIGPLVAVALAWLASGLAKRRAARPGGESPALLRYPHLTSGCLVSFARGLNDTPKILGLLAAGAVLSPSSGTAAIVAAMAVGGLLGAWRVARTLGRRITPMSESEGLAGNAVTAALVIGASRIGLPVSTTHVSTGGIVGIGLGSGELRWRATTGVFGAWAATLPVAAVLSAVVMVGLQ